MIIRLFQHNYDYIYKVEQSSRLRMTDTNKKVTVTDAVGRNPNAAKKGGNTGFGPKFRMA